MSSPIGGACKPVEIVASWHLCAFALVQLRFSGRLVRPTLRGAFLGLEIGTNQSILPVGAGRFGRTPHIVLSGAFLALRASDCNGWPRRWVSGRRRDWDPGSPWKWTHVISTGSGALRQFQIGRASLWG